MKSKTYIVSDGVKSREITAETLAEFCLSVCGGGYTEEQTAKAMERQRTAIETGRLSTNLTIKEVTDDNSTN